MTDLSKLSRGSGRHSGAEKATWKRRAGHPGGPYTVAQKLGRPGEPVVSPSLEALAGSPDALKAFLLADEGYFVHTLRLQPWEDSPLVNRQDRCTHGHAIGTTWATYGCGDQHEAHALRRRLMWEIEARSDVTFEELRTHDPAVRRGAWDRLAAFTETIGMTDVEWEQLKERFGSNQPRGHPSSREEITMAQKETRPSVRPTAFSSQGDPRPPAREATPVPTVPSKARDAKNHPRDVHRGGKVG